MDPRGVRHKDTKRSSVRVHIASTHPLAAGFRSPHESVNNLHRRRRSWQLGVASMHVRAARARTLEVAIRAYAENALLIARPRFYISSPTPRTVARPCNATPTESVTNRRTTVFRICLSRNHDDKPIQKCAAGCHHGNTIRLIDRV